MVILIFDVSSAPYLSKKLEYTKTCKRPRSQVFYWTIQFQTPRVGLEPTTARLTAACSTDWAIEEYQRTTRVLYNTNFILSRIFANFPNFFPVRQLPYCIKNSFISLGLPDSLLGSAWPAMYQEFSVPVSYAGGISMIIAAGTILSSLQSDHLTTNFGTGKLQLSAYLWQPLHCLDSLSAILT